MNYYWIVPLTAAAANIGLAIVMQRSGPRGAVSRVFIFMASMLVLFNLNFFALSYFSDIETASSIGRVLRTGTLFVFPAIIHLFYVQRPRESFVGEALLVADYVCAAALALSNWFDLLISGLRPVPWGYAVVGTAFYNIFTLFAVVNFATAIVMLIVDYVRADTPRARLQLRFWLLGAFIALPLGITNALPAYDVPIYPLGSLGNAAWAGIAAYAIVRHRLMDIDLAVTKSVAYAAVVVAVIIPVFVVTLWLEERSFGQIHTDFSFFLLLTFLGVAGLFPVLRAQAELRIERSFFRDRHEYRSILSNFARSIVRILDRERLLSELTSTLTQALSVDRLAIVLLEARLRQLTVHTSIGPPPEPRSFSATHPLILALGEHQCSVLYSELATAGREAENDVASVLKSNGWEVCIPLSVGSEVLGFIALGPKRSLEAYSSGDLDLLDTLAAEASVALENARLYDELKRSQEIIRRADRLSALGTLAAGIAHEVRNPLVSIQTFFQLAPDRRDDDEFFGEFLTMAANEVKRINHLISELLSFARSPARSPKAVDVNELVERVVALLDPEARKNRLTLKCSLAPDSLHAHADEDQVKQILINLVLNAIQASGPGGMVSVSTARCERDGAEFVRLEITDAGVGIARSQIEHIFVPFFTTKEKGTGLGLAIVHQLVTEHGGYIEVTSQEGLGTRFSVDLPAAPAPVLLLVEESPDTSEMRVRRRA